MCICGPEFFRILSIELTHGQPDQVLRRADAVVLSQATAIKYFGDQNPIGKLLVLNEQNSFTVTAYLRSVRTLI
jgi:putative ABC transport system permease protein